MPHKVEMSGGIVKEFENVEPDGILRCCICNSHGFQVGFVVEKENEGRLVGFKCVECNAVMPIQTNSRLAIASAPQEEIH